MLHAQFQFQINNIFSLPGILRECVSR